MGGRGANGGKGARQLRAGLLAGAAIAIGVWSSREDGHEADVRAFRAVNAGHGAAADRALGGVTELGSLWASAGAGAVLAALGRRRAAGRALAAAGATWALGQGLKRIFDRPRPYQAYPEAVRRMIGKPSAASWPSSHPAVLTAFLTVAARELGASHSARLGLDVLAAAVGASRTYLGVHYPSDVLGGLLVGRAVGLAWPGAPRTADEG